MTNMSFKPSSPYPNSSVSNRCWRSQSHMGSDEVDLCISHKKTTIIGRS